MNSVKSDLQGLPPSQLWTDLHDILLKLPDALNKLDQMLHSNRAKCLEQQEQFLRRHPKIKGGVDSPQRLIAMQQWENAKEKRLGRMPEDELIITPDGVERRPEFEAAQVEANGLVEALYQQSKESLRYRRLAGEDRAALLNFWKDWDYVPPSELPLGAKRLRAQIAEALFHPTEMQMQGLLELAERRKAELLAQSVEQDTAGSGRDAPADVKPPGVAFRGMTWQQAMKAAEGHCARNPFPGVKALAKIVGCSPSTMSKAIDRSAKLRARLAEHEAQRKSVFAGAMSEAAAASAKQSREPDPIDAVSASTDDRFRRLLEQAKPSERAKLNAKTPAQRRELIAIIEHDPDKAQTVRGPKR